MNNLSRYANEKFKHIVEDYEANKLDPLMMEAIRYVAQQAYNDGWQDAKDLIPGVNCPTGLRGDPG